MKEQLLLFMMALLPLVANADAVEINGLWYNLDDIAKTAEVTSCPTKYSGNIIIPENVTYEANIYRVVNIAKAAFGFCDELTSVKIPGTISNLISDVFRNCSNLETVTICNGVKCIGAWTFQHCYKLSKVELPNSITIIGVSAFTACSSLNSIDLPNGITTIGESAFTGCGLSSIIIPNSVKTIGCAAFSGCSDLQTISLGKGLTYMGSSAFKGCSNLQSIEIPNGITNIAQNTFQGCSNLSSVNLGNKITYIGASAFDGCNSLTDITIPSKLTTIESSTFQNCSGLTAVSIPNSVNCIGSLAFDGCNNLETIIIGSGIKDIGYCAFNGASKLMDVFCYANDVPSTSAAAFQSLPSGARLHVPSSSISKYKQITPWNGFNNYIAISDDMPVISSEITVNMSSNIATFSSPYPLDFSSVSGVKAYVGSGYNPSTGDLTLTRIYAVPAGEGLLLKGDAGIYNVPCVETNNFSANLLIGAPEDIIIDPIEGDYSNFILSNDPIKGVGFYPLSASGSLTAGKAYLQLPTSILPAASRSLRMVFEDEEEEVTGINSLNEKGAMSNEKFFDLQGRRVEKPTRGLYIKDGKKIMVK